MGPSLVKPIIFISYCHKDEPNPAGPGENPWLTYVQSFLQPAMKHAAFEIWTDENIPGGDEWEQHIKAKLAACHICILLVSRHSLNSRYCINVEIEAIRQRQEQQEQVHVYPIILTPVPRTALEPIRHLNLKPKDGKPLSTFEKPDRDTAMSAIADEIAAMLGGRPDSIMAPPTEPSRQPSFVHITGLPETGYERLVGRDARLKRLDDAWADRNTNILSLVAEGGAGKSALVNEWLKQMQAEQYCGAEAVLGWSFYSQGSKERATSSDEFLNWTIERLGIRINTTSAPAKGEVIAEALARRRVLLVLDGCEPLQHGLGTQQGELKDLGLRALLRRFAAMPPAVAHGLVVLTSRLAVNDIARWKDSAAPVVDVEELSDEAGAALLRDNRVWGTDVELQAAARSFGGHPLALSLLASFLKETQFGDVRRRDHIRAFFADPENPRHDHARRVMESYEKEWLTDDPAPPAGGFFAGIFQRPRYSEKARMRAIMHVVGLFDRPASGDCLAALRRKPAIRGLTNSLVVLDEREWRRAVARLREVRLLAPEDPAVPNTVDAHPLVREWFGQRLEQANLDAWRAAHGRLYEHLRHTTREGRTPTPEDLAPLYQAIPHGCRAGRDREALDVYVNRICRWSARYRGLEAYAFQKLGAVGSNLAAVSWFFEKPYEMPVAAFSAANRAWVLAEAAILLKAQGRFTEALPAMRAALRTAVAAKHWRNAARRASVLSDTQSLVGEVAAAVESAEQSVTYADHGGNVFEILISRTTCADAMHTAGQRKEAEDLFTDAEHRQKRREPAHPQLYSRRGYQYCDLLLTKREWTAARDRASRTLEGAELDNWLIDVALDTLTIGRANLGLALASGRGSRCVRSWQRQRNLAASRRRVERRTSAMTRDDARAAKTRLGEAVEGLHTAGQLDDIPRGLLARATFRRSVGNWDGAARDLDEVVEIAEPGPMRLFLCDTALERARLAFARIEAFAPLNALIDDSPAQPAVLSDAKRKSLHDEAAKQLAIAADYITTCGYHKRDEELAELQAVRDGRRRFADLPPRV
jgi:tetratricopeptide (TPR) repeat protein